MRLRILAMTCIVCCLITSIYAVPAYPGWQTRSLSDGSPVTVRLHGDEFFHYWETTDGQLAIEQADGTFVISDQVLPTLKEQKTRRNKARALRMPQTAGNLNLAPKGVVILVNFSDSQMKSSNTLATFNNLCNATNCITNRHNGVYYGSAAQYFEDQSNGAYRPQFDVIGPVTLPHPTAYYGEEGKLHEEDEDTQNDMYLADFVIDAILAAENQGCDFSQYDSDNDGYVDFVYFMYAGKGQAAGGTSETIWPHNWTLISALYLGFTHGTSEYYMNSWYDCNLLSVDGKFINNYACSAELDNNGSLSGIGTLCHEFGHVMGLPDLYDTEYGNNYNNHLTPGEWDIMDRGSYNGGGHCPPNYNPWEKAYFGWVSPLNPGHKGTNCTLYANGTEDYNVYQINESGSLQTATTSGLCYYLENRQQCGWDTYLPTHGMVIWKVDYDENLWYSNAPNNTPDELHLTVVCSSGTIIGDVWEYNESTHRYVHLNDGKNNVFGGVSGVDEWEGVSGKPVTEITETDSVITFKYKGGAQEGDENWYYYDDGDNQTTIGTNGGTFWWGIMIPAGSVQKSNPYLTHVAVAELSEHNTQPITIDIYSGGAIPQETNKIYTQTVQPEAANAWHVIALNEPVAVDKQKNLWIILNEDTDAYPAVVSNDTGDPNGRWISTNGTEWVDLANYNLNYTFMLRAYIIDQTNEDVEIVESGEWKEKSQKILQNGQIFILRDGKIYNILGTKVH